MITISGSSGKAAIIESIKSYYPDTIVVSTEVRGTMFSDYIGPPDSLSVEALQKVVGDKEYDYFILYVMTRKADISKYKKIFSEFEESKRLLVRHFVFVHA